MTARPEGSSPRAGPPEVGSPAATVLGMALLRAGVPLSLLVDLACGPRSEEVLAVERPTAVPG